jgi:hypothetical protein
VEEYSQQFTLDYSASHLLSFNHSLVKCFPDSDVETRFFSLNKHYESVQRLCSGWIESQERKYFTLTRVTEAVHGRDSIR